jgi:hypothetical protein
MITKHSIWLAAPVIVAITAAMVLGLGRPQAHAQQPIDPASFSPVITNPLFPLSSLGPKTFVGEDTDEETGETVEERLESRVLPETATVAGVTVLVLEEKGYVDGDLVEVALDYFAQHSNGDVYYFGERVDNYEDGVVANHEGQWLAGEDGNEPGVIMPAQPEVGKTYDQELAPGVAEDKATVLSLSESVSTPSGSYSGCLKTREFSPLEPGVEEFKFHCPGAGLVREESESGFIELVSIGPASVSATPVPSPSPAAPPAAPRAGVIAPSAGAGQDAHEPLTWWLIAAAAGTLLIAAGVAMRGRAD